MFCFVLEVLSGVECCVELGDFVWSCVVACGVEWT